MPKKHEPCPVKSYEFHVGPDGEDGNPHSLNIEFAYCETTDHVDENEILSLTLSLPREAAEEFGTTLLAFLAKTWREDVEAGTD